MIAHRFMTDLSPWGSLQVFSARACNHGDGHSRNGGGAQLYLPRQWPQLQTGADHLHSWQAREMRHEPQQFELEDHRADVPGGEPVDGTCELRLDHAGSDEQALNLAQEWAS